MDRNTPILVVDDYRTMLRIVSNLLRQLGFSDVDTASDGTEALAMLEARPYGLVISDWSMQPVSGLDLLREIRRRPALAGLPFLMVTADDRTENVVAAREAGVNGYVVKPFNAATLRSGIEGALSA